MATALAIHGAALLAGTEAPHNSRRPYGSPALGDHNDSLRTSSSCCSAPSVSSLPAATPPTTMTRPRATTTTMRQETTTRRETTTTRRETTTRDRRRRRRDRDDDDAKDDDDSAGDDAISPNCDSSWAGCTENEFAANDFTAVTGDIFIAMVPMQNYDPPCLTVAVGQTVSVQATGGHPFQRVCAEDSVMDSQNLSTSDVTFTFTTPGYYNYECQFHSSMKGNIKVIP